MIKDADAKLSEGQLDAIAMYEWYIKNTDHNYFGKTWCYRMCHCDLYYQCIDKRVKLYLNVSPASEKFYSHMQSKTEEFLKIAGSYKDIMQILELCDYKSRKYNDSKYGGVKSILGEAIDWTIFHPDYSAIEISLESKLYEEIKALGWKPLSSIMGTADLSGFFRRTIGNIVKEAECEVPYYDNYINAKIYITRLVEEKAVSFNIGDAEYVQRIKIEFMTGQKMCIQNSEFGSLTFF